MNAAVNRRVVWIALIAVVLSVPLFSEETVESKRKDVLKYGLEGDIIALIGELQGEKDTGYSAELLDVFGKTKSVAIKKGVLALFAEQKNGQLKDFSLGLLADPFEYSKDLVRQTLSYVSELNVSEAAPLARKIIEDESADFRDAAIQTLGKIGTSDDAVFLIGYMDSEIPGDEKQRLIVRQNVMAALGDMKASGIRDRLVEIMKDPDENAVIRGSAATALGKIGNPQDASVVSDLLSESDPIIRTAAITALGGLNAPEATAAILEGFKDSYYKVRIEAIGAAERRQLSEAVPYVLYRAKTDPVPAVRVRAFEALAKFDDADSRSWLLSVIADDKRPDAERAKACDVLVNSSLSFDFTAIEKAVLATVKDDKKLKLRYEFGKALSRTKDPRPETIANAFIASKDTLTKSIGLDFYEKNRYGSMDEAVKAIATDEKQGALQKRARKILDSVETK